MQEGTALLLPTGEEVKYVCDYPMNSTLVIIKRPSDTAKPLIEAVDKSILKVKPLIKRIHIEIYRLGNEDVAYCFNSDDESTRHRTRFIEESKKIPNPWRYIGSYSLNTPI
jgi:hypothetical protein